MKQNMRKFTVAASTFVVAALFSFGWSGQNGVSLSVEKAEARVGRPLTPVSVAGVARRQYRRAAIGTAAAVGGRRMGRGLSQGYEFPTTVTMTVLGSPRSLPWRYPIRFRSPYRHPPSLSGGGLLCGWAVVRLQRVG